MKFKLVEDKESKYSSIVIPYDRLEITVRSDSYRSPSQTSNGWELPDADDYTTTIKWEHKVDWDEFNNALWEIMEDDNREIERILKDNGKEKKERTEGGK